MRLTAQNMRDIDQTFWDVTIACRGKCVYCGLDGSKDIRILRNFCLDHLIPRQANGVHDKQNRVLSCSYCNRDCKGNYDPRKDAPSLAGRKVLLEQAAKYVRERQHSDFFSELYKALGSQ
jgi:5-methylcytosine-specific restriction endonuclease McrA